MRKALYSVDPYNLKKIKVVYCNKCGAYLGEYFKDSNILYRLGRSQPVTGGKIKCWSCGNEVVINK